MKRPRLQYSTKVFRNLQREYGYTEEIAALAMDLKPHELHKVKRNLAAVDAYRGGD